MHASPSGGMGEEGESHSRWRSSLGELVPTFEMVSFRESSVRAALMSLASSAGSREKSAATAPATWGHAMLVPEMVW